LTFCILRCKIAEVAVLCCAHEVLGQWPFAVVVLHLDSLFEIGFAGHLQDAHLQSSNRNTTHWHNI